MSGKISGIYVEIRGDYKQLKEDLSQAKAIVTQQSKGMSDALNNSLSPDQIKKSVDKMVGSLNTLSNASKIANRSFDGIGVNLKQYSTLVGVTEKEFAKLQSRMIQTSAAKAQETALRNIANAADLSAKEVAQLGKQMGVSAAGIAAVNGAAGSASSSMTMLGSAAKTAIGFMSVYTVIEFARGIVEAGLAMDSLNRSFLAITGSQKEAADTMAFLRAESDRLGLNFYELAPQFKGLQAAARGTAMEGENVRKLFTSMAAASSALGLSADDSAGALKALTQMMSKQKITAEELRGQLAERMPDATQLMAKAIGTSTGELNKMLELGLVISDDVLPAFADAVLKAYEAAAQTAALESGRAATNRLATAWTDLKTNLYDNEAFVSATNSIAYMVRGIDYLLQGRGDIVDTIGKMQANEGMLSAMFPSRFAVDFFKQYQATAKKANEVVKESFTATWQELERRNTVLANNFMAKEGEKSGKVQAENAKIIESFNKASQTQLQRLTEDRDKYLKAAEGDAKKKAEIEAWYTSEVAKLNEKATKKNASELSQQLKDAELAAKEKAKLAAKYAEETRQNNALLDKYWEEYSDKQVKAVADRFEEEKKIREKAAEDALRAAEKQAEEQAEAAQKVLDRIQEGTADVFYDMFQDIGNGWSTLWDSMKNWALRTIAEIAAKAATTQIVVPILMSLTGAGTANAAVNALTGGANGGGFNLSTLSSLVQPGSMLSKIPGMDYVTSLLATQLPGTTMLSGGALALAGGGTAGGSVASLAAAQNLAGMTGGLSIGSALGMGALGGLGYSLLGGSLGLPQNQYTGITSSLGGALGAWGGTALATSSAGAALGATAGSVVPIIGTVLGAIGGGMLSSLFGGDERSPSVIFQAQQTAWGNVDPTTYQFHTKDGGKGGLAIAEQLATVAGTAFQEVEAVVATLGEKYIGILNDSTVEWGRKAGGSWEEWDFGADHDINKLLEKAAADLTGQIYKAASGAFEAAGRDLSAGDDATAALSMLSEKAAGQFAELQATIAAGVQSGNVEAYIASLQNFQSVVQTLTGTWAAISQASSELVTPLTQYEQAQRSVNQQYDAWTTQLEALGFAAEQVAKIDADRAEVLANLAAENKKAIDDVLQTSAQIATPLSESAAAVQQVNEKFDSLVKQADALGAAESALAQIERDRQTALSNLAAITDDVVDLEKALAELGKTFDGLAGEIASGLEEMVSGARSALTSAYNAERSAISAALDGVLDGMRLEIDGLNSAMESAADAASAWRSVASTLKSAVSDIMPMTLPQAMAGIDAMIAGAFRGQAPDADELSKIVGVLSGIETRDYATRADYDAARGTAAAKLSTLAEISDTRVSVEQRQLDALAGQREALDAQIALAESAGAAQLEALELTYQNAVAQLDALEGIQKYSGSMDDALGMIQALTRQYGDIQAGLARAQATAALGTYDAMTKAVTILETVRDGMGRADVPGFASGGYHAGGLRIVGENGPELEMTGPSRIWSADDTRAMLSGGGSDAAEIRALREDLRAQSRAMVAMQQRMTKLLERWNVDGMPEVRTA